VPNIDGLSSTAGSSAITRWSCLAEFAFAPQTVDSDGDFVQGILTQDQYEIIET
jgi:hypothetical protein